eukprot:s247_g16.t1
MQSCGHLCSWLCQSRTARSPCGSTAKDAWTVVEEAWEDYILKKAQGFHSPQSSTRPSTSSTPSTTCTRKDAWTTVEESWEDYILWKKAQGFHSPRSSTAPSTPSTRSISSSPFTPSTGCTPKAKLCQEKKDGDGVDGRPRESKPLLQGFIRLQKEAKMFRQQLEQTSPSQEVDGRLPEHESLLQGFIRLQKEAKVFQQQVEQTPPSQDPSEGHVPPKVQAQKLRNQLKNDPKQRRKFRKLLRQWQQPEVKDTSAIFQLLQQGLEFL